MMNFVESEEQEDYTDDSHVSLSHPQKKEEGRGKKRKKVTFHDFDDRLCLKEKMIESPSFFDPLCSSSSSCRLLTFFLSCAFQYG